MHQWKAAIHPLAHPPPLFTFITLITSLISLTLVLSRPWLGLAYPSPHLTLPGVDLSTQYRVITYVGARCCTLYY